VNDWVLDEEEMAGLRPASDELASAASSKNFFEEISNQERLFAVTLE
jgi:hypothetical protein